MSGAVLGALFVGGASRRMGGLPKGLLRGEGGITLVERWRRLFAAEGVEGVLVGAHPAYAGLGLEIVPDAPAGVGPLGGLLASLRRAGARPLLVAACDMPFVSGRLLARLRSFEAPTPVVAAERGGRREPFFARYDPPRVLPLAEARLRRGQLSLQGLLAEAGVTALPLSPRELGELDDWDSPADMSRTR